MTIYNVLFKIDDLSFAKKDWINYRRFSWIPGKQDAPLEKWSEKKYHLLLKKVVKALTDLYLYKVMLSPNQY